MFDNSPHPAKNHAGGMAPLVNVERGTITINKSKFEKNLTEFQKSTDKN